MKYLISEDYLKTLTSINQNIDVSLLLPYIETSETTWLSKIITKDFYNDLKEKYTNQTLSSIEIDLVNIIKPALAYKCVWSALPFIHLKLRNKGLMLENSEFSQQGTLEDLKYLRSEINTYFVSYENDLIDFLLLNINEFPLYSNNADCSDKSRKEKSTISGIKFY